MVNGSPQVHRTARRVVVVLEVKMEFTWEEVIKQVHEESGATGLPPDEEGAHTGLLVYGSPYSLVLNPQPRPVTTSSGLFLNLTVEL